MHEDDDRRKSVRHAGGGSEGTRGFVIGAVGAAIVILVIMAFSGTGFFGEDAGSPDAASDSVPTGDGG
ncbi:hypothetical protein [uncultured Nitratireductor sp.]|uniref:hypothetical protein n=1 Tax=uncultured Nitratireductor sp. TaxID=520953 RepID=UPI0025F6ED08|nr:hypothetical protein [uncultured Nitratireductor sp.]